MGYYEDKRISNSGLSKLNPEQGGSPARYLNYLEEDKERKELQYLERGRMLHMSILEPELYKVAPIDKPEAKMGEVADHMLADWKGLTDTAVLAACEAVGYGQSWKEETRISKVVDQTAEYLQFMVEAQDSGAIVISKSTKDIVDSCHMAVQKHNKARALIFQHPNAKKEEEFFVELKDAAGRDTEVKAKIDMHFAAEEGRGIMVDLKSTSKPVSLFPSSFQWFRYYRQMAFYTDVLIQSGVYTHVTPYIVAVETAEPFEVAIFKIDPDWIWYGQQEYQRLLGLYNYYKDNDWKHDQEWTIGMLGADAAPKSIIDPQEIGELAGIIDFNQPSLDELV